MKMTLHSYKTSSNRRNAPNPMATTQDYAENMAILCSPKTKIVYTMPLIDLPPADASTMLTVLTKAQGIAEAVGQEYVVFTCDQQLYRIAVQVIWENPAKFDNVYVRLGGMYLLMSFCGCVRSLMSDSGLEEILGSAFGGISKMISGKKVPPQCLCTSYYCDQSFKNIL